MNSDTTDEQDEQGYYDEDQSEDLDAADNDDLWDWASSD